MAIPSPQLVTVSGNISDQRLDIDNSTWQLSTNTNESVILYGITSDAGTAYEIGYLKERPAAINFDGSNAAPAVSGETEVTTLGAIASTKFYVDYDRAFMLFPDGHSTPVNVTYSGLGSIQKAKDINSAIGIAEKYQVHDFVSTPTTNGTGNALVEGDLAFDSTANVLKAYNGSVWETAKPTPTEQTNINTVSGISTDVTTVAGQISPTNRISTVSTNIGNVDIVGNDLSNNYVYIDDNGAITDSVTSTTGTSNIETVADDITNVNTVAGGIADVNRYAAEYTISATAPTSPAPVEGNLWADTTSNLLKHYNGSSWAEVSSTGITNIVDDTTPQLGGTLDAQNNNLTNVGTISGTNISIDFGSIT